MSPNIKCKRNCRNTKSPITPKDDNRSNSTKKNIRHGKKQKKSCPKIRRKHKSIKIKPVSIETLDLEGKDIKTVMFTDCTLHQILYTQKVETRKLKLQNVK